MNKEWDIEFIVFKSYNIKSIMLKTKLTSVQK